MIYSLILITAVGVQNVGTYNNAAECQQAAQEWQRQKIQAGCVQQESPEQMLLKVQGVMKSMMENIK